MFYIDFEFSDLKYANTFFEFLHFFNHKKIQKIALSFQSTKNDMKKLRVFGDENTLHEFLNEELKTQYGKFKLKNFIEEQNNIKHVFKNSEIKKAPDTNKFVSLERIRGCEGDILIAYNNLIKNKNKEIEKIKLSEKGNDFIENTIKKIENRYNKKSVELFELQKEKNNGTITYFKYHNHGNNIKIYVKQIFHNYQNDGDINDFGLSGNKKHTLPFW